MITSRTSWVARALVVTCGAVMPGCANFIEHASDRVWQEVGTPEPPISNAQGDFTVTSISTGQGDTVQAGDLVHARVWTGPASDPADFNAWLWTGREPLGDGVYPQRLELGPARLRALLIGMRVGTRFSVQGEDLPCCNALRVPIFGLAPRDAQHELSRVEEYNWPVGTLSGRKNQLAKIEILDTCRAHLFERRATVEQWGYVFNIFDMHYPAFRHGTLAWGALQADCPAPRKAMRLEIGPLYDNTGELLDWDLSYARASRVTHPGPRTALIVFVAAFAIAWSAAKKKLSAAVGG